MSATISRALAALWLSSALPTHASDLSASELPTLVVAPTSNDGNVWTTPHGVSIITARDLEKAPVSSLGALLAREAGLTLKSYFGSDKNATLDIRGMGDTATSNVLVMVDGMRLNEADLSGADLSSIALADIERIEIVRGGGAVRYGDGAVGGVINIVTRAPAATRLRGEARLETASYASHALRASLTGGSAGWRLRATGSRSVTDGYRNNSGLDRSDASLEVRHSTTLDGFTPEVFARFSFHQDRYGLPGPVSAAEFAGSESERRSTKSPFDEGRTDDRMFTLGTNLDFGTAGLLEIQARWRDRDNPYIMGYTPLLTRADQANRIESNRQDFQLRYSRDIDAFGRSHSLALGGHWQSADYVRRMNGENRVGSSSRTLGDLNGHGVYAESVLRGPEGWSLHAGARANRLQSRTGEQRYTQTCDYIIVIAPPLNIPIPVPINCSNAYQMQGERNNLWHNRAYELGLVWEATPRTVLFASANRQFRAPNIDELAQASADLRPQTGTTLELGIRTRPQDRAELSATVFGMNNQNEIYYASDLNLNRNYDQATKRRGGEIQTRWQVAAPLTLVANLAYVRPRFANTGADIPHVPRWTAHTRVEWRVQPRLDLLASLRYVGKRYDGNDVTNQAYPALHSYRLVDLGARYAPTKAFELSAAVNNLFDETYSTLAYSTTYYPMPGRNFSLSAAWRF